MEEKIMEKEMREGIEEMEERVGEGRGNPQEILLQEIEDLREASRVLLDLIIRGNPEDWLIQGIDPYSALANLARALAVLMKEWREISKEKTTSKVELRDLL